MDKVAVVILNWNGEAMMRRFLPSVVKHSSGTAAVVVADNGSTDDSLPMLRKEFPQVRTVELNENYGFAEGYNRALAQVEADYFVLLNSDVEVTAGWLHPLLTYMEAHPEVAACQPKILSESKRDTFEYAGAAGGFIDRYGYPFCRGRIFGTIEHDQGQYDTVLPVLWASGAALMVRRSDWEAVGGLDGRFFAHMEEIDFCWRLCLRGRGVVCIPESRIYHVGGGTLNARSPRKTYLNFRNNLLMLYKNLPEADLRPVMRLRCLLDYVAALKLLLTDGPAHFAAVVRARRDFRRLRPDFAAARAENLRLSTREPLAGRIQESLLALYYIKGKKTFSSLHLKI